MGMRPYPVAWNSRKNVVYCGSTIEATVAVIDCDTDSVVASIPLPGDNLLDLVWNYVNDKVYCSVSWENSVFVFDATTNRVLDSFRMRSGPCEMAWDPIANRTFVPNCDGSSVSVLRDNPPGITGPGSTLTRTCPVTPTVIKGMLPLATREFAVLLDITGREVAKLLPGENDVRHLSPGVYFVRPASSVERRASSIRKVILTR
jgi:DNA-binding beta-propeller fold protein YncE